MVPFDVVINVSVFNSAHSASFISSYQLTSYTPSETATPFQQLKNEVFQKNQGLKVNWTGISLVVNGFSILTLKGNLDWLKDIEFFKTYVNEGGGNSVANLPERFGLIDYNRKIRIEFEKGQIVILPV